jgi:hypothetical protein
VCKMCTTHLSPQLDGMDGHYIQTEEEHLWQVISNMLVRLGWEATTLPAGLENIHKWKHRYNACQHDFPKEATSTL